MISAAIASLGLAQRLRGLLPYLGVGVLALALLGGLWARGNYYRAERDAAVSALAATEASYRAAAAARQASDLANVQRVDGINDTNAKEVTDEYQARIAALRADFAERVRLASAGNSRGAGGAGVPGVPAAAGRADEATCTAEFPPAAALACSENTEQLIALQAWNKKTAAIDVNGTVPR